MNHTNTKHGFALGIIVAIVAILALGGGAAYVATKNRADVNTGSGTSTAATGTTRGFLNSNTTTSAKLNASATGTANANVNANLDVSASGSVEFKGPPVSDKKPATHTVSYTGAGFSPALLTITKGDTVTFVNNSGGGMWVASDSHPTHLLYPEFDAKASVAAGGSYSFTFGKIGTWGFHNHLDAAAKGVIAVK